MPPFPSFSAFDPKKIRTQALLDNYGLTDQGFDPSQGMIGGARDPFSGPNLFPPDSPGIQPPNGVNPSPSYQDMVNQMGTFETPMQDKYQGLLSARPEREKPGLMRTLVAAGMGLGSKDPFKTEEEVMYAPYNREMADWTSQVEPAYKSAQLENTANANERAMRGTILTNKTNMDRYEAMNDQTTRRYDLQQQKQEAAAAVDKVRADAYDFKMRHPDWKFDFSGPQVIAASPDGTQAVKLGPTGHMSDADKINLNQKNELARIEARGREAQETKATPSGTPSGASGNPVVQRNMRFQHVYDNYGPEITKYLKPPQTTNGTWQFTEEPTGGMLTGSKDLAQQKANYAKAKQLVNAGIGISPTGVSADSTTKKPPIGGSNTPPPASKPEPIPPPSSARTLSPDEFVGPEFIASEEERTRANLRSKVVTAKANEEEELNRVINDPKSPNQIRIAAKRRLESLRYDKSQNPSNVIEDASKSQPNERRKSTDGGKTWQYSHDGGKTWGNE